MKLLLPLLFLALVVAVYGPAVEPKQEASDDAAEYARVHLDHRVGYPRLGRWVRGRWWYPWYDSEDQVPAEDKETLKELGTEMADELEQLVAGTEEEEVLDELEEQAEAEEEASEYGVVRRRLHRCHTRRRFGLPCRPLLRHRVRRLPVHRPHHRRL
uniref:Putative secreted protein n=1 Tax=Ixodes ricinus TaxID=34613 RepID=A0A131YAN6_IXORI